MSLDLPFSMGIVIIFDLPGQPIHIVRRSGSCIIVWYSSWLQLPHKGIHEIGLYPLLVVFRGLFALVYGIR